MKHAMKHRHRTQPVTVDFFARSCSNRCVSALLDRYSFFPQHKQNILDGKNQ